MILEYAVTGANPLLFPRFLDVGATCKLKAMHRNKASTLFIGSLNPECQIIKVSVCHRREDDMAEWDQEKLESVVAQKHGAEKGNSNRATEIICKFFLDAVEAKQYGWCAPVPQQSKPWFLRTLCPASTIARRPSSTAGVCQDTHAVTHATRDSPKGVSCALGRPPVQLVRAWICLELHTRLSAYITAATPLCPASPTDCTSTCASLCISPHIASTEQVEVMPTAAVAAAGSGRAPTGRSASTSTRCRPAIS